ncbi:hypothetical protein WCD93_29970 [Klebsiella michiganensis]|uniref:hypothetical protein n=1 Tax=Klebsiella michiganensis TaxID=1134687 RepID=UPI0034D6188C
MDDLTLRYYEAEMRYLREAGRSLCDRAGRVRAANASAIRSMKGIKGTFEWQQ